MGVVISVYSLLSCLPNEKSILERYSLIDLAQHAHITKGGANCSPFIIFSTDTNIAKPLEKSIMVNNNKRSMMTVYSDPECPFSHRTRIVIQEKNITVNIEQLFDGHLPEEIAAASPYGTTPVLLERDITLFDANIINAYFDERFLQPPLMPSDPASRATSRSMLYRIDKDWYSLWRALIGLEKGKMNKARKTVQEDLTVLAPLFAQSEFFMSDEFSLLDCSLAPLLWRLPLLKIKLPEKAKAVEEYAERIFSRPSFQASLSEQERAMR
jgi:RNA polymerase-associated protein